MPAAAPLLTAVPFAATSDACPAELLNARPMRSSAVRMEICEAFVETFFAKSIVPVLISIARAAITSKLHAIVVTTSTSVSPALFVGMRRFIRVF